MLINEVSKLTNLTKKAIEYYIEQELVFPNVLENGYRNFSENDVECLKKIYVFRKLGLSTTEIRAVLADATNNTLQKITVLKELSIQREQAKKAILENLSFGKDYAELSSELRAIEQSSTVNEKLLEAFPGYYGRFICLHFARFLNEPITTSEQQSAYEEIIAFLDNVPSLQFTEDLQLFLMESTKQMNTENIRDVLENTKQSIENPDKFLLENKEVIERYLAYKQSEEYKNSPIYKIQTILKEFNDTSGYYDVFIPAMKKLSVSYSEYFKQIEVANEKLSFIYPEINNFNKE
ncbi:MerR family transcriptional regulator [Robertmurraya kyonggiensis]|uniref:MerR family transcriptional regulator n=1 Tax=Robertmurraya kyonggiensis TaxID=1037680 RepID=A0A4U1D3J2_9BACI|nr:MerR family transcriptional regulator [Robertmurraya kyonggiensis]TKC16368.1 MerR family transcriptional regulator [Robertmurraya kyonggiensis]